LKFILTATSATIIQHLKTYRKPSEGKKAVAIAYYYFSFRESIEIANDRVDTAVESLLRSIIKQLCQDLARLPEAVHPIHKNHQRSKSIDVGTLKETLIPLAKELGQTYIVIDALEEFGDPVHNKSTISRAREELVKVLKQLSECDRMHLLVTSRDGEAREHIDEELQALTEKPGYQDIQLDGERVKQDIELMIKEELESPIWKSLRREDPKLLKEIMDTVRNSNGM